MFFLTPEARDAALPLALLVVTLIVAYLIGRGRRVGDHPTCRRCDFDLFGNADAERCPECGADLGRPRARAIGERHVRHGWKRAAMALAFVFAFWAGAKMYATFTGLKVVEYKPASMLVDDLSALDQQRRAAAVRELRRRLAADKLDLEPQLKFLADLPALLTGEAQPSLLELDTLTAEIYEKLPSDRPVSLLPYWEALATIAASQGDQRQRTAVGRLLWWYDRGAPIGGRDEVPATLFAAMAQPLLEMQADRSVQWIAAYGDAIAVAYLHRLLPEELVRQYQQNMVRVELEIGSELRAGERLPFLYSVEQRGHTPAQERLGNPNWELGIGKPSFRLDDGPDLFKQRTRFFFDIQGSVRSSGAGYLVLDETKLPPPGVYEAVYEVPMVLWVRGREPVHEWVATARADLDLRPADAPAAIPEDARLRVDGTPVPVRAPVGARACALSGATTGRP